MKMISTLSNIKVLVLLFSLFAGFTLQAQVEEVKEEEATEEETEPTKDKRPVRSTFESIWLIDNQTVDVPIKGTFEMDINHRFGLMNKNNYKDLYGVFAASNIRLGFNYVPINNLQVGFGFTKDSELWDFSAKYAIMRQGRSGGNPVSITYYGVMAIDTRGDDETLYQDGKTQKFDPFNDRFSYFNQIMVGRKVNDWFSIQLAPSLSYFNYVDRANPLTPRMKNMHFAIAMSSRFKITDVTSFLINTDHPLTNHDVDNPKPNVSFGLEFVSSAHAFQIFVGNYKSIIPQYNNAKNQNDYEKGPWFLGEGDFLIGFNMTRLWNF
jgi:hypothetical protein